MSWIGWSNRCPAWRTRTTSRTTAPTDAETPSRKAKEWRVAARRPFLDAARTPAWARALYVPGLAAKHAAYAEYVVLERRK